jgi:hypothetical protein
LIASLHDQGVRVIVVSGSEMPELPLVNAAGILEKPFTEGELLLKLRPLIAQKAIR